ncbi:helix-turn-helix domain-containing protein [Herbiconiux sp. P16]|uniref:helix-turn-helix domain-containing protein n=1 Tax=Herbiconiux wuyangfengii TaxID=3342794 RepID=UPI0035B7FAD5
MDDAVAVGAAIRAARKNNLLSQGQLAELAGVSERTVRDIEKGRGSVSFGSVVAAAAVLGLRIGIV